MQRWISQSNIHLNFFLECDNNAGVIPNLLVRGVNIRIVSKETPTQETLVLFVHSNTGYNVQHLGKSPDSKNWMNGGAAHPRRAVTPRVGRIYREATDNNGADRNNYAYLFVPGILMLQ